VLWYRITQPDFDVFFSERDATGALTRWTSYTGCLQANESVRAQSAIFEGRPLEEFCCGEPLYGALQMADVQGEKWIRYRRTDGSFGYLRMTMLKACAGN
jgi:hypothetical protein